MRRVAAALTLGIAACGGADRNPVVPDPMAPVVAPITQPTVGNSPPDVVFPPTLPPQPSRFHVVLLGNLHDPESGPLCGPQYCLDARATGACGPRVAFRCTCLAGAEAELTTGVGPGVCTLDVWVRDDAGAIATLTTRFEVEAP